MRELRNAAERLALGLDAALWADAPAPAPQTNLAEQMAAHEKSLLAASLAAHGGSLKSTYEALGLSRKALYEKMQKHGLARETFRDD